MLNLFKFVNPFNAHFVKQIKKLLYYHCVNSVHTRSYSSPYFPVFWLNTEKYSCHQHVLFLISASSFLAEGWREVSSRRTQQEALQFYLHLPVSLFVCPSASLFAFLFVLKTTKPNFSGKLIASPIFRKRRRKIKFLMES